MGADFNDRARGRTEEQLRDELDGLVPHRRGSVTRQRFELVRFKNVKLGNTPPYLVKDLIPRDGLVLIWGAPKCGKSFLVLDLVMHVALGWEYRRHRVTQGSVVYIACEGERGLAARVAAFRLKHGLNGADPDFYLVTSRLDLAAEHEQLAADIRAQIGSAVPVAVVIDTLNRSIAGSESKDEDMGAYIKAADTIRETFACAVIIIHHCGIESSRPRGHTSLVGAVDAEISVKRDASGPIVATVVRMKDGPEGLVVGSNLEVVEVDRNEDEVVTSCVIVPAEISAAATRSKPRKLRAAERVALDALADVLARHGEVPPSNSHIPANIPCVAEKLWRDNAIARGLSDSDNSDNQKRAFRRARTELVAAGRVGNWQEFSWLI
jgi:hypothetical protein